MRNIVFPGLGPEFRGIFLDFQAVFIVVMCFFTGFVGFRMVSATSDHQHQGLLQWQPREIGLLLEEAQAIASKAEHAFGEALFQARKPSNIIRNR